jgi:hypothetical protein
MATNIPTSLVVAFDCTAEEAALVEEIVRRSEHWLPVRLKLRFAPHDYSKPWNKYVGSEGNLLHDFQKGSHVQYGSWLADRLNGFGNGVLEGIRSFAAAPQPDAVVSDGPPA